MKKVFTFLLLTFLFIININADVTMSYDKAVNNSQRYVYKFNKYGKYIITDKKYIEIVNSDTAIIPFAFKNNKSTVNTDFTRGGLLNEEEFIVSKDSNGNTYLSQDVEFFLMKDGTIKAINVLNNDVIDAGDKKYALRVTEFVIPGTKTKGSGTKNNPWEFVGTYKLTFYIENGKITNNNLLVNKYIVYAVESTEGQIVINFKPDSSFTYYNNNCDFEYEYDKTNKIHRIFKPNKDITSDKECTINLIAAGLLVQYDLNGGTGNCESLSVTKGSKLTNICTSVSKPGYMFKGWKDASGNIVTKDTIVNDNLKLTAEWEIKKYTLTINPNGGTWNNTTSNSTKTGTINSTLSIANPTPKGYTVSFNSNGGNNVNSITSQRTFTNWSLSGSGSMSGTTYTFGSGNATLTANYNNGSITLPSATKAGHNFKGWYSNGCGSTFIGNAGESYTPTSNVTLRACYSYYAYILDVYPNGGTWNGTTEKTRIEPLANPKPSIYGNTDYTGKIGSTIDIPNPTPPSGYTVSFNTNGGSSVSSITSTKSFNGWNNSSPGTFSGTTYTYGEGSGYITANYKNNSVNLPKPTKSGYTFVGWYTASSGGTKVNNTYTPTENITLYAHWSANSYTLTINPNGGTWNNTTSNSTKTGTTNSKLSIANPTPKGYTVSFNSNGGNNVNSITSQRTFTNWSLSGSGSMSGTTYTFGSGNATLTANYNNGSITLPSATKAGHNFKGWYSNGCGSTFIGNAGESYTPTSNVTLRACYSYYAYILDVYPNGGTWNGTTEKTRIEPLANPKPSIYGNTDYTGKIGSTIDIPNPTPPSGYTVSFNTNGGSSVSSITSTKSFNGWNNSSPGTFSGTTYTYGEGSGYITANYKNNSVNLPKPTKSGYTFVGWYTASSGGTKVNNTYTPTENITLYAHWSANSYTLSFDANGCGTLGVSYVTATVGKTYGDADDGDGLPSIALTTGKNFDGWYTSSSGGNKITNSTTVTASSDNGTLYAHCSYINYNINYNLANGTHGSSHPTSAKYEDVINISKPSKKVTINLSRGTNASNATISSTSVSAAQTFAGWTATNLNTTTARRGTSSSSVNTQWSSGSTKSTYTYYKNLTVTNNATVKLTANWTQKSVTLPTITKSGYKCGWATSSTATTYTYESGATYVPNANGSSNLTLYGVCKRIAPPSLTVKFTTSAGYTNTCTDTYTTSHGSCTFNDGYYAPLSLSIVATDTNEVTNMKLEYNKPGQTSYTDITGSYELSPTKSGNTYTAKTSIGSTGKRKLRITATNNQGKTGTVILNINIIPQTFAAQNNCTDKTITAAGNIFVWKGESSCTNASKSPCGQMQKDTIGVISQGAELCYVKTISSTSNAKFIAAWIEKSQFKYKGGVLTEGYPGYGTATTKTFNGKTYYYSKLVAWCNNASCGYGWVIKPEI